MANLDSNRPKSCNKTKVSFFRCCKMALDSNSNQHYTEEHSPTNASELRSGKKMNHKTYRFNQQASNCATKPAHKCFIFQKNTSARGLWMYMEMNRSTLWLWYITFLWDKNYRVQSKINKCYERISALVGGISTLTFFPPSVTSLWRHILVNNSATLSGDSLWTGRNNLIRSIN